ncbi:MAG: YcxB family protein [Luteolibacter sp.]
MRREDALAFSRAYHDSSQTFRRMQTKVRLMLPAIMVIFWIYSTWRYGFNTATTCIYLGMAVLWFFIYPHRYRRNVDKYSEKMIDEGSYGKNFGSYELLLSGDGIHSTGPSGTSTFYWSSIDRVSLTETYLFIFLNGPIGYPIPIQDIGKEAALDAQAYVEKHISANAVRSS